jgi:hypothetical protein
VPPNYLDGAKVFFTATGVFGVADDATPIVGLAIARYDDDRLDAVYLLACDSQWKVVGDLLYASIQEAQQDAERFYDVSPIQWEQV